MSVYTRLDYVSASQKDISSFGPISNTGKLLVLVLLASCFGMPYP